MFIPYGVFFEKNGRLYLSAQGTISGRERLSAVFPAGLVGDAVVFLPAFRAD